MSIEQEQQIVDTIANETARLSSLRESQRIEVRLKKKTNDSADSAAIAAEQARVDQIRAEKIAFEQECRKEAEEKKSLLQAVINECDESGYPMPPSLIKLLNHTNGNFFFLY